MHCDLRPRAATDSRRTDGGTISGRRRRALLRAAWCAALESTRIALLNLSEEADWLVHGEVA